MSAEHEDGSPSAPSEPPAKAETPSKSDKPSAPPRSSSEASEASEVRSGPPKAEPTSAAPSRDAASEEPSLGLIGWLQDRIGWDGLKDGLAGRRAPRQGVSFYFGGITLFLLVLQVSSGILLMLYYKPDAAQAYPSVERIIGELPYGKLVRATHVWASDLFVAFLLGHFFTVILRRTYRAPREMAWLGGLVSLFLGIGLAFTGAILPWSQTAQTDARVGSHLANYVPFIGDELRRFMRGGEEVTGATLGHAFGFHVAALPAVLTVAIAFHMLIIARKPSARVVSKDLANTIPVWPDFFVRGAGLTTAVMVLIMTLVVFIERPLGVAADFKAASPNTSYAPWYFLPIDQLVRVAPREMLGMDGARFLVGAGCFLGLLVVALPFIDRRGSKITAWLAAGLLLVLILLSSRAFI